MKLNYMGSGKVYFNDKEYRCDLYINENEGGILININISNTEASFLHLPMNIDFLVGQLSTGFKFSLISCERQGMSIKMPERRSVYTYHSKYLIKGVGERTDKSLKLNIVNFRVNNILAWGGISAYKVIDNFELSHNNNIEKEVCRNDEFIVKYWVSNSMLPIVPCELLKEKIVLNQSANIEISFKNEQSIDKFAKIFNSCFKTNNLNEFKKRIKTVILKDRAKEWIERDRNFLMANSNKFITLESRLADLLLAEFQIYFDTGDIKYYDFPNVIANTRNYYIHYDESIKKRGRILTENELSIYNRSLLYMLEYYILVELGFSNISKLIKKLNMRWGRISQALSIIRYSNENKKQ